MKVYKTGMVQVRGTYRDSAGVVYRDSAVIATKVVRLDELLPWLRSHNHLDLANQLEEQT